MRTKRHKSYISIVALAVIITLVIGAALVSYFIRHANAYDGLKNYTQISGEYSTALDLSKQPHLGDPGASIKVVEFADFKCPACKRWSDKDFHTFKTMYIDTGKVEFFFVNFAFIDRDSISAAAAGEAIYKQNPDAFWVFYKKLYENQQDESAIWATPEYLSKFVETNVPDIDYNQFYNDMTSNAVLLKVKEDFKSAGKLGVNGTPQFLINGNLVASDRLESTIESIN